MELWALKAIYLFGIVLSIVLTGLLSYLVFSKTKWSVENVSLRSSLNSIMSGVFLALIFVHVLPESQMLLRDTSESLHNQIPLAETMLVVTLILIMFFHYVGLALANRSSEAGKEGSGSGEDTSLADPAASKQSEDDDADSKDYGSISSGKDGKTSLVSDSKQANLERVAALVLMAGAFSLHNFFEGLALGLQTSHAKTLTFFLAIIAHKCIMVVVLIFQAMRSGSPIQSTILSMASFTICAIAGVVVGTVVEHLSSMDSRFGIANGFLQSIVAGTILYVAIFNLLGEEFILNTGSVVKVAWLTLGFLAMGSLRLLHHLGGSTNHTVAMEQHNHTMT